MIISQYISNDIFKPVIMYLYTFIHITIFFNIYFLT